MTDSLHIGPHRDYEPEGVYRAPHRRTTRRQRWALGIAYVALFLILWLRFAIQDLELYDGDLIAALFSGTVVLLAIVFVIMLPVILVLIGLTWAVILGVAKGLLTVDRWLRATPGRSTVSHV